MQVHGSYFYLPARQPENSLYGVLVAIQEVRTIRYPKSISCLICRWKRPAPQAVCAKSMINRPFGQPEPPVRLAD